MSGTPYFTALWTAVLATNFWKEVKKELTGTDGFVGRYEQRRLRLSWPTQKDDRRTESQHANARVNTCPLKARSCPRSFLDDQIRGNISKFHHGYAVSQTHPRKVMYGPIL